MTTILKPRVMQKILTHNRDYQRAVALLNQQWEPDDQLLFHDVLQAPDVQFARQLQVAKLVQGQVDLSDYQAVNKLLMQHDSWFSPAARQELLAPFRE